MRALSKGTNTVLIKFVGGVLLARKAQSKQGANVILTGWSLSWCSDVVLFESGILGPKKLQNGLHHKPVITPLTNTTFLGA
jgi:hypothetical protein